MIDNGGVLNNYSDEDGDSPGIAITDVNLGGGTLYYSLDNGTSWSDVGTVSADSARVLYADSDTRLAFTPAANFHGNISDVFGFRVLEDLIAVMSACPQDKNPINGADAKPSEIHFIIKA